MIAKDEVRRYALLETIADYCLSCGDGTRAEVRRCIHKNCPLYPYRRGGSTDDTTTADIYQAIVAHCTICMGGSKRAIGDCPSGRCELRGAKEL